MPLFPYSFKKEVLSTFDPQQKSLLGKTYYKFFKKPASSHSLDSLFYTTDNNSMGSSVGSMLVNDYGQDMDVHHARVKDNYQKKGIGTEQIRLAALQRKKAKRTGELGLIPTSTLASIIYEKIGFIFDGDTRTKAERALAKQDASERPNFSTGMNLPQEEIDILLLRPPLSQEKKD